MIEFTVYGQPMGKQRPRTVRNGSFTRTYTPEKTVSYENLVKLEYDRQCKERFGDNEPLSLEIVAYFSIPKSVGKKKKEQMIQNTIRPTKKPDADNIMKIIADSLNGIAYRDDTQIVNATIEKVYAEIPRVEVKISKI